MLISDTIDSKYIKSDEIAGREVTLTVSHVQMELIGMGSDQQSKPVLYFRGQNKGIVLNKTNRYLLKEALGDETESWANKKVILYVENTMFQGKPTKGLRIKVPTGMNLPPKPRMPIDIEAMGKSIERDPELKKHTETEPWEPIPSVVIEAEAMARQGVDKFRDWKSRLNDKEFEQLQPELNRILALAKDAERTMKNG